MPLQGSLGHLGLGDVLQSGLAGKREGSLLVRRGGERAVLRIADGSLHLLSPEAIDPESAIDAFVARGTLGRAAVEEFRKDATDSLVVLDRLVERGLLDERELLDLVGSAAEDAILDLLTWQEGYFRFDESASAPRRVGLTARVAVDPGSLLLRAAQRLDERHEVSRGLGARSVLFLATGVTPPADSASDGGAEVHALLDGRATIDEIAHRLGLGRFDALKAVLRLVRGGAARVASVQELDSGAAGRASAGQHAAARALLLQWSDAARTDPEPLRRMAELAAQRQQVDEEADALLHMAEILVAAGRAPEAIEACRTALARRPGDPDAAEALRAAARVAGEARIYRETTLQLAGDALAVDDAERCAALLAELDPVDFGDLSVRLLRAKALVRLKDRIALIAEVEAIAAQAAGGAKRKAEREAVVFCRDAIAVLAPEQTELLRRLQDLCTGRRRVPKKVALVGALLLVVATAGFLLWPEGPGGLLERTRTAIAEGDRAAAAELLARLVEEYPDAEETQEALRLQSSTEARRKRASLPTVDGATRKSVEAQVPGWIAALRGLPGDAARVALAEAAETIEKPELAALRGAVAPRLHPHLRTAVQALTRSARVRSDTLANLRVQVQSRKPQVDVVRAVLEEATAYRTDGFADQATECREIVVRLAPAEGQDPLRADLRELDQALKLLRAALKSYDADFDACRRIVAEADLEADYETCREEAPKLLVAGRLDDADACYLRLEDRLGVYEKDPVLVPIVESATKRQFPQFLRDRRGQIAEIRRGMSAAATAEASGDLAAAGRIYADLAKRFWFVRFENLFTVPLVVHTTPPGARVFLNGRDAGTAPVTVRYGWASQTSITVEAPGYESRTEILGTADPAPRSSLTIHLHPRAAWTAEVSPSHSSRPTALGEDLLVVDRSGRVTRLAGADGKVRWARQLQSLEGVRSRCAVGGDLIAVAHVDGRLAFLSPEDGSVLEEVTVGRPVGDAAAIDDRFAVATLGKRLEIHRGRRPAHSVPLEGEPTAGVLAAHGAFWVGHADGTVDRVDAVTGRLRHVALSRARAPVLGLAASARGVLATTGAGTLHALDASGTEAWRSESLGDLVGDPGAAAGLAATIDRQGRVLLFDLASGEPRGQEDLKAEAIGGLLGVDGFLVASLLDGRNWIYDAEARHTLTHAFATPDPARFAPGSLGGARVALPAPRRSLQVVTLSR